MTGRFALKAALATGLVVLLLSGVASATPQVIVQNNADSGAGSLRQAILSVDPGGTIVIPASVGEITLTSGRLLIEKSMTIEGAGAAQTVVSAGNNSQVFAVTGTPTVTIEGVQIINGMVNSPGMEVYGGGIEQSGGSLTVADSLISQNTLETGTTGFPKGAGIGVKTGATSLTLRNTIVADNRGHGFHSWGGGVYVAGASLTIEGGAVKGNTIEGSTAIGGGLVFKGTQATISHVALTGNELRFFGTPILGEGGGLALEGGTGDVLDGVTIARNRAILNDAINENATVRGAGAGLGAAGASLVNSTITGNTASATVKSNGRVVGGGLFLSQPTSLVGSTIAANTAVASGTAATTEAGGDLAVQDAGSATIRDTIVAAGTSIAGSENCFEATAGQLVSEGHNIDSRDQCRFQAGGDQVNTDPGLGPLAENGGPVETMALQPGSRAIDTGGAVGAGGCPFTDARGVLRRATGACDVGAYEVATPTATTGGATDIGLDRATVGAIGANPDLSGAVMFFQYGTTNAYGIQTASQPVAATTPVAELSTQLTGLEPGTTYHYRVGITNAVGTAFGGDSTFATAAAAKGPGAAAESAKLTLKHLRGLLFRVHCSGAPCHGNLVATTRSGKRRVVVAKAKLMVVAGATKKVKLTLTGKGKGLVALRGTLPVVVKATLGGATPSVPKPLRFRLQ